MPLRNVTLSLPDDLVRQAKVAAAARDMSLSALIAELLEQVTQDENYTGCGEKSRP